MISPEISTDWHGSWPVMLTAFLPDLKIDWVGIDSLTDWYLESGSSGLFSACLSSEANLMSADEIVALAQRVVRRTGGRVPVAAGAMGAPSLQARSELTKRLHGAGADVVILVVNDFAAETETDSIATQRLLDFSATVSDVPLGLYECPVPYKRLIEPASLGQLARSGQFFWLKETSCDAELIARKVNAAAGTPLKIFNANLALLDRAIQSGAAGFSGIIANFFPKLIADLCEAAAQYDAAGQSTFEMVRTIDAELVEATYQSAYPAVAKYCAARQGVAIAEHCRVSSRPIPRSARQLTDRVLERLSVATDAA